MPRRLQHILCFDDFERATQRHLVPAGLSRWGASMNCPRTPTIVTMTAHRAEGHR